MVNRLSDRDSRLIGVLRGRYHVLGSRYPRRVLLGMLPGAYVTGLLAVAGTALYVEVTLGELVRLLLVAWVLIWTVDVAVEARLILRRLGPIEAWIDGDRDEEASRAAWEAAAGLPMAYLRQPWMYAAIVVGLGLWDLYAVWDLDLPAYSAAIWFPGSLIVYGYWVVLRFLALELSLRPVLEDIASSLPDETELSPLRLSLRTRLLIALPAVNLITGIAVGGFSAEDSADLGNFALALLGSVIAAVLVSSWLIAFLSASIVSPIAQLREANRRVGEGELSTRVPVSSSDETADLARSFNEMVIGLEERDRLRDAFGAFVDPELAKRVAKEGTDLAGEEVEVSVLFLDVRGFTSYSERVSAREAVARLNDLYERVVPIITTHGGHANKFIGDGLLAVFGAPARLSDHADRATGAAVEIARSVAEAYDGELRVGVGVNSGSVMSGTIGGGGKLDFTVIGDVVNTAARVESATRDTGDDVLITEATRSRLEGADGWTERPGLDLKGKSERVELFAPADSG